MYIYYLVYRAHIVPPPFEMNPSPSQRRPQVLCQLATCRGFSMTSHWGAGHTSPSRFPKETHGEYMERIRKTSGNWEHVGFFSSKRVEKTKYKDGG